MTDGNGKYDKSPEEGNYTIPGPGVYRLDNHRVLPPPEGPIFMVVSDLDGTMVGDDATTLRFKKYWQREAVLRGCRLVFSTGRTLEQYLELAEEKAGTLVEPDGLISGVGTRVYTCTGRGQWEEDKAWTAVLSEGWNESVVRATCEAAIQVCGEEQMHFRPEREMNSHKVTVGVHVDKLRAAEEHIRGALAAEGVRAKIIVSGCGDWRFLDVVPEMAGKLESLEYVRQQYNIPKDRTVGCGDSGNDIAMFEGENLSIVVGNAQADLCEWLDARMPTMGTRDNGQPRIVKTTKTVADGILEGLQFFGLY